MYYNSIYLCCQVKWWSYRVTIPTYLGASQASVPYSSPFIWYYRLDSNQHTLRYKLSRLTNRRTIA